MRWVAILGLILTTFGSALTDPAAGSILISAGVDAAGRTAGLGEIQV